MRPGTRHHVVTVEDCLAIGGHFYNRDTFDRTAIGILQQHFLGVVLNNTEHSNATLILMKLVHHYNHLTQLDDEISQNIRNSKSFIQFPKHYSNFYC
jgi:hypothetical protein